MTTTDINDVNGPAQTGTFSGPVQTVTVTIPSSSEIPPELQSATLRQMILGVIKALQDLEVRTYERNERDDHDREEQRAKNAEHRAHVTAHLAKIDTAVHELIGSIRMVRAVAAGLTVADLVLIAELGRRMGWW